jgi:hypothetical protein
VKEADWGTCTDPEKMLQYLRANGTASDRKLRLFAAACCRRVWHLVTHAPARDAVQVTEAYADGRTTTDRLRSARLAAGANAVVARNASREAAHTAAKTASWEARAMAADAAWEAAGRPARYHIRDAAWDDESGAHCGLIRDIFGNPFRPLPPLDPSLLKGNNGVIMSLAQAAYNERLLPQGTLDNGRLAVLADALEEGGMTDRALLTHLRSPGPHVRGCHGLDAVLGRS